MNNDIIRFPVVPTAERFFGINRVHPLMQRAVYDILYSWSKDNNVKKIILFGSSITNRCTPRSDIDVYVDLRDNIPLDLSVIYQHHKNADVWTNFTVDENLYNSITKTGITLYDGKTEPCITIDNWRNLYGRRNSFDKSL